MFLKTKSIGCYEYYSLISWEEMGEYLNAIPVPDTFTSYVFEPMPP